MSQAKQRRAKAAIPRMQAHSFEWTIPYHELNEGLEELDVMEDIAAHAFEAWRPGKVGIYEELGELFKAHDAASFNHFLPAGFALPVKGLVSPHLFRHGQARESALAMAIKHSEESHADALARAGMSAEAVRIMRSWLETVRVGNLLQSELQVTRMAVLSKSEQSQAESVPMFDHDPNETLGVAEFSKLLGVSAETVRRREGEGKVIAFLGSHRKRGRAYPVFQTWAGISGEPLVEVLSHLSGSGAEAFAFFTGINESLAGLTPIEVLLGKLTSARDVAAGQWLLAQDGSKRRAAVVAAADVHSQY
jgi:hypothetical protein